MCFSCTLYFAGSKAQESAPLEALVITPLTGLQTALARLNVCDDQHVVSPNNLLLCPLS